MHSDSYVSAVPSLFLRVPPPSIDFETVQSRKRMKKSIDADEVTMQETIHYDNEIDNSQKFVEDIILVEINPVEASNDLELYHEAKELNENLQDLETYYEEIEGSEDIEERYLSLNDSNFITVRDCSTQTDTDYFLQNYRLLINKKKNLKDELAKWNDRYKKLVINVKYLEAKVQDLTRSLEEMHSAVKIKKRK